MDFISHGNTQVRQLGLFPILSSKTPTDLRHHYSRRKPRPILDIPALDIQNEPTPTDKGSQAASTGLQGLPFWKTLDTTPLTSPPANSERCPHNPDQSINRSRSPRQSRFRQGVHEDSSRTRDSMSVPHPAFSLHPTSA